jgi:hypothetical protein
VIEKLLDDGDMVAAGLVRAYHQLGEFCLVVRTDRAGRSACRVIGQQVGNEVMSAFLQQCAEALFDGPTIVTKPGEG